MSPLRATEDHVIPLPLEEYYSKDFVLRKYVENELPENVG